MNGAYVFCVCVCIWFKSFRVWQLISCPYSLSISIHLILVAVASFLSIAAFSFQWFCVSPFLVMPILIFIVLIVVFIMNFFFFCYKSHRFISFIPIECDIVHTILVLYILIGPKSRISCSYIHLPYVIWIHSFFLSIFKICWSWKFHYTSISIWVYLRDLWNHLFRGFVWIEFLFCMKKWARHAV